MSKSNDITQVIENRRIIEYQKAQDSAEHHNTMIWILVPAGLGLSLVILKTIWIDTFSNEISLDVRTLMPLFRFFLLFIGVYTLNYIITLVCSANENKDIKYKICRKIELDLSFIGNHSLIKKKYNGLNLFFFGVVCILIGYLLSIKYLYEGFPFFSNTAIGLELFEFVLYLILSTYILYVLYSPAIHVINCIRIKLCQFFVRLQKF